MFMCVVNLKSVNTLDLTWKQSFLILSITIKHVTQHNNATPHYADIPHYDDTQHNN